MISKLCDRGQHRAVDADDPPGCTGCSGCDCHPRHGKAPEVWPGAPRPLTAMRGATSTPTAY